MTPFSARGRFCGAKATNTSDGRRIAICQAWLAHWQWKSRRLLFSTDAGQFFMQLPAGKIYDLAPACDFNFTKIAHRCHYGATLTCMLMAGKIERNISNFLY